MKNKHVFASGLSFYKLFLIFMIISVLGSFYEEILNLAMTYYNTGIISYELRRGVIYGPFNIIYGLGAALMAKILVPKQSNWKKVFLDGALIGGIVEFSLSYLEEKFTGNVSWDYSGKLLNICGRTTIPYMAFWGLLSIFLVYEVYPFLSKIIEKIPYKFGMIMTKILIILMALDMFISFSAIIRETLRDMNFPPYTVIGTFCDKYYPDDFLNKIYPNMHRRS